ncbi:homing endonuclease [Mycobacterium phage Gaia]|uniref:Homing endonuclease n=1 Tax=Mycobacterium phage Gaia TaxID=1486472 RepID=A0A068F8Z4_9CAUD|nr:homing endonuclease [Mycobacterium phage Gaia]AID58985.1 homing endonuclease [Mycobacterium phage Gaia]AYR00094.1 HNH endonuclease [Mycobacterium phage Nebkiss]
MAWKNGGAGSRIPARLRARVKARDKHCQLGYKGCTGAMDEIDHIVNVKALKIDRSQANDINNLQAVCLSCHKKKTQAEAAAGRRKHLRTLTPPGLAGG